MTARSGSVGSMKSTPHTAWMVWLLVIVFVGMLGCSSGSGGDTEICDNGLDDDSNGLIDCRDHACFDHEHCTGGDGDGDADGDGDGDGDGDADGDADGDSDADECDRECDPASLYDHCERGDCSEFGTDTTDCCVSSEITCNTVLSIGEMYDDLEVAYRGFYSNEHQCSVERFDSLGHDTMVFRAQTRGLACEYGFIQVRVRAYLDAIDLNTTYALCDDVDHQALNVTVNVGEGGMDQTNFTNYECTSPGEFVLREIGNETGQPYDFYLRGRLMEINSSGATTGVTVDIEIDSTGIVQVILES
jgi:hypothetical protein